MDKIKQLKDEVWMMWQIFIVSNECFDYTFYLHKPDTKEEADYLAKSKDFHFIRQMLWRMTIIELSKLFSSSAKRDKYNLFHLITKLKKNGYYGNLSVSEETLSQWETKLNDKQELIEKILNLRDKLYAHTDPDKDNYVDLVIKFTEIKELLLIIEDVIKELYRQVFDAGAHIDNLFFDRNQFHIIKILCEDEKRKINEIINRSNKR
jgi:hypothetical protein